jgi:serine/threonine protein kinase
MQQCLTENTLVELVEERLSPAAQKEVQHHIDDCAVCRALVVGMAKACFREGERGIVDSRQSEPRTDPSSSGTLPASAEERGAQPLGRGQPEWQGGDHDTELDRQPDHARQGTHKMIGQLIGNYRVVRLLGQGGMGQVFEAVHEQIRRRAAIKMLHAEYSRNSEIVARFFNEALAVNVVQHPSIVGVFESGQTSTGAAYIVMEFLEGETLLKRLERERTLPEPTALLIGRQIASALAATHAKEIIHRDLKADNVMLVPDLEVPGGQRVKILDFGLAKVGAKHQGQAVATKDGVVMGTPSYMAPEQWLSATMTDDKTDVYALGTLLFLMLSGRYPFAAENANQLMMLVMYEEPASLREHAPQVSAVTAELVHSMLEKKRNARPSMKDVTVRLEQILASLPAPNAAPASPKPQPRLPPSVSEAKTEIGAGPVQPEKLAWTDIKMTPDPPQTAQPQDETLQVKAVAVKLPLLLPKTGSSEDETRQVRAVEMPQTEKKNALAPPKASPAKQVAPASPKRSSVPLLVGIGLVVLVAAVLAVLLSR